MNSAQPSGPAAPEGPRESGTPKKSSWAPSRATEAPRRVGYSASFAQRLGVALKLIGALCGLGTAVLFVRPLVQGEVTPGPRYITLSPTTPAPAEERSPGGKTGDSPRRAPTAPVPAENPSEAPPDTDTAEPALAPGQAIQESRSAFKGALLVLESTPSGATVVVDGLNQGETPVTVGLDCTPGKTLSVRFSLRGFENTTHRTPCPRDALITVKAQLRKGTGKTSGKGSGKR